MDPEGIVWMRGFLRSLAAAGRAVLVSSHLMSELEDTADHLVTVGRGMVIADTSVAGLLAAASGDLALLRTTAPDAAARVLEDAGACVTAAEPGALTVTGLGTGQIAAVLGQQAVPFSELSAHRATLEEAYLGLTQDAVEYRAAPAGSPRASTGAGGVRP
jgi:ABC-2 type transport system ATP-binding protein